MKKKILIVSFMVLSIMVLVLNQYLSITYHMNIFKYFSTNHQLTEEDREFLRQHGPIVFAYDNNSPPLRYFDEVNGQYKGIVVDYLRALSLELETEIQFVPMVWEDALEALKRGEIDICDMYPSEARAKVYLFSDPVYYQRGSILISKSNTTIHKASDLEGKRVAVQNGDYAGSFVNSSVPNVTFSYSKDYEENLLKLIHGDVDALIGDEPVIMYFIDLYNLREEFIIAEEPLYVLPSVFSLPLDQKKLQTIINKGIYALNQKDIITKIQLKWFGISTPQDNTAQEEKMMLLVLGLALVASMVIFTIVFWNIELQKAVELQTKALKISKNNLQTIIDGLNQLIVVVSDDLKVLSANALFYKLFGLNPEIENLQLDHVIPGVSDVVKSKWVVKREAGEHIIKGRTYLITPYKIHYEEKEKPSTILMFDDVTDRKVSEARLLQDNKMSAVGQLATGVAHEIRNPLGLIRNYAFLLKRNKNDEKILNQSLAVIEESVDKASNIIDNLLNFSRLTDNTLRQVNLKQVIEELVSLNDKLMNKGQLHCQLVLEEVTMTVQVESLKHIIINLINNAIEAMPNKGKITVWLKNAPNGPVIHVIDNGSGMSDETKARLFDPFFTTKEVGAGTGLGLYIVYNEINKINGRIDVFSKEGKGTTFKLQLKSEDEVNHAK